MAFVGWIDDIWFNSPSLQLLHNSSLGIADFVFSMHAENEEGGPIGMGTMMMEGWSRGAGANLVRLVSCS